MKKLKFFLIALIFFCTGFFLGQSYQIPSLVVPVENISSMASQPLTMVIRYADNGLNEFQNIPITQSISVLDLLNKVAVENNLSIATQNYGELGILVTQIGERKNGDNNQYWQYEVNGQQPEIGAGAYMLSGGERVEWRFAEFKDNQNN